jgi:hypothetical protein
MADLTDEQIAGIRDRLSKATGFLDRKTLTVALQDVITDDKTIQAVWRTLRSLDPSEVKRLLEGLSKKQHEEDFPLNILTVDRLHHVLPVLVHPYSALIRYEKAERLAELTGQRLESFDLICDLRPIYDESRKYLEGMMPYTRLRVVATGVDGLPKSFEAELTHQQVHDLAEKASKAKDKLDVLRKSVDKWVPGGLPDLPLTRIPRKGSSDG